MEKWRKTYNIDTFLDDAWINEYQHRDYSFMIKKTDNNTVQVYVYTDAGETVTLTISLTEPKAKDVIRQLVKDGSLVNTTVDELEAMGICASKGGRYHTLSLEQEIAYLTAKANNEMISVLSYSVRENKIYEYEHVTRRYTAVYDADGVLIQDGEIRNIPLSFQFETSTLKSAIEYIKRHNEPRKL